MAKWNVKVTTRTGFEVAFVVYDGDNALEAAAHALDDWQFHMPNIVVTGLSVEEA